MPEMEYPEALAALAAASRPGMRLGLESTRELLAALGDPQRDLRGVLVAGTNGKGSVCSLVAGVARQAGHKVALLTKPHLTSYRERIQLEDGPIDEAAFARLVEEVLSAASKSSSPGAGATHHEMLTAMGFLAARQSAADVTVCEVGLGGRLDATNVWDGGIAALVSVGLDHQAQLGATIPEIAGEKAAIIKSGDLAVSGVGPEAAPVVAAAAARAGAVLWQTGEAIDFRWETEPGSGSPRLRVRTPRRELSGLRIGLVGAIQGANAALAVAIADGLDAEGISVPDSAVREGLAGASWPGRLQRVPGRPEVLVDAAHNPHAVTAILPELRAAAAGRRSVLLFGAMRDHDHEGMLRLLASLGFADAVFTSARAVRAVRPDRLSLEWPSAATCTGPVDAALRRAQQLAGPEGQVVCLGSIYVIGEVLAALGQGLPPDPEVPFQPNW